MFLALGVFPNTQYKAPGAPCLLGQWEGVGAGSSSGKTTRPATLLFELLAFPNCQSIETWLKISLNAKLSLKPPVSAPLEMGHHVKIETLNHLVFLSFIQLCYEVQSPLANKLCLKGIRCAGRILSGGNWLLFILQKSRPPKITLRGDVLPTLSLTFGQPLSSA